MREEDPLGRAHAVETAGEALHLGAPDRIALGVPLGLDIDDIESERVFLDHTVDAAVARPTDGLTHLRPAAAVAHGNQQIDDQPLEESRRHFANAFEEVVFQEPRPKI